MRDCGGGAPRGSANSCREGFPLGGRARRRLWVAGGAQELWRRHPREQAVPLPYPGVLSFPAALSPVLSIPSSSVGHSLAPPEQQCGQLGRFVFSGGRDGGEPQSHAALCVPALLSLQCEQPARLCLGYRPVPRARRSERSAAGARCHSAAGRGRGQGKGVSELCCLLSLVSCSADARRDGQWERSPQLFPALMPFCKCFSSTSGVIR